MSGDTRVLVGGARFRTTAPRVFAERAPNISAGRRATIEHSPNIPAVRRATAERSPNIPAGRRDATDRTLAISANASWIDRILAISAAAGGRRDDVGIVLEDPTLPGYVIVAILGTIAHLIVVRRADGLLPRSPHL